MNDRDIPWRPADEAPTLVPLLCYWCPSPDAEDEEDRPEFWGVAVRCREHGVDRWYQHCPLWEKGLGNPYPGYPDFFAPLGRPEGNPKWVVGSDDSVEYLKGGNSTVPLKVDGCADDAERDHCWCHACREKRPLTMNDIRMVVCPTCGNKRCPKASDHRNICGDSNELGQPGSIFR